MRHKYETRCIVLSRAPAGETNASLTLLTPDIGLVHARAQGVRRSGAKLASALSTFAESELVLVRGKESWRIAGAILKENWFLRMRHATPRARAARICRFLLRLVADEMDNAALFLTMDGFFKALAVLPEDKHEAAEILAALRILSALGLDTEHIPNTASPFAPELLTEIKKNRAQYITRINRGIDASGL